MYSPTSTHKYTLIPKCTFSFTQHKHPSTPRTNYYVDELHGILISLVLNILMTLHISGSKLDFNISA